MKGYFFLKNNDLWDDVVARFPFGSWTAKMTRHGAEAPMGHQSQFNRVQLIRLKENS